MKSVGKIVAEFDGNGHIEMTISGAVGPTELTLLRCQLGIEFGLYAEKLGKYFDPTVHKAREDANRQHEVEEAKRREIDSKPKEKANA